MVRIPLLIRYPQRCAPQVNSMAVDLTDLMPTLLHWTGIPTPSQAQGRNLAPYLSGERDPSESRRYSFSERVQPPPQRGRRLGPIRSSFMIRGRGWKYIRYLQGDEYLYHLAEDPGETRNLAGRPEHRSRRDELALELDRWLQRTTPAERRSSTLFPIPLAERKVVQP